MVAAEGFPLLLRWVPFVPTPPLPFGPPPPPPFSGSPLARGDHLAKDHASSPFSSLRSAHHQTVFGTLGLDPVFSDRRYSGSCQFAFALTRPATAVPSRVCWTVTSARKRLLRQASTGGPSFGSPLSFMCKGAIVFQKRGLRSRPISAPSPISVVGAAALGRPRTPTSPLSSTPGESAPGRPPPPHRRKREKN